MKIAVDTRLLHNPTSGMGVYLSEILQRLKKTDSKDEYYDLEYTLPKSNFLEKFIDLLYEQLWIQFFVPISIVKQKIEILYSPNPPTSLFVTIPVVLTIPDLSFCFDESINFFIKTYLFWVYKLSALKASKITTFSENSRKDIIRILKIDSNKIEVVNPAIKDQFRINISSFQKKQVKAKFGISKNYILSVPGTFIPRKNVNDLLLSFCNLPAKIKEDFILVFVGSKKHSSFNSFIDQVKILNLEKKVIVTGYISTLDLDILYKEAFMFITTSLYEGFGLTPLEAMSRKIPVISYNNSSLSEIVGDAGLKVKNKEELSVAILELITQSKLRNQLIKKGLSWIKKYDWNQSSQKLIKIFQNI